MTRLLSGFILLVVFIFSSLFYQQFYIPKLIVFHAMAIAGMVFLCCKPEIFIPEKNISFFLAAFLMIAAVFGIRTDMPLTELMHWSYYLSGIVLYLVFLNLPEDSRISLLKAVYAAGLLQLPVMVMQILAIQHLMPAPLTSHTEHVFGTLGNQEFLATLIGVAFFIGMHLQSQQTKQQVKYYYLTANLSLLLALFFAQNKGGMIFVVLFFLWQYRPNTRLFLTLAALILIVASLTFPASIMGRILLWLAASTIFLKHFFSGAGILQFENHYLDAVHQLFSTYPIIMKWFGPYTASAIDTHNIFLQFAVMFGVLGVFLAILFMRYALKLANSQQTHLGAALLFLLYKSLYTVVLSSITGMLLIALLMAIFSRKQLLQLKKYSSAMFLPISILAFVPVAILAFSDFHYQKGVRALFFGQSEISRTHFMHSQEIYPENVDANLALALAALSLSNTSDMHLRLQRALLYRKNKDTLKIAASMYFHAGKYDNAFHHYQFLHETFPDHLTSMTKLAAIYIIRQDYANAYAMAQSVLHAKPRRHAESDEMNIQIARKISADSFPFAEARRTKIIGEMHENN